MGPTYLALLAATGVAAAVVSARRGRLADLRGDVAIVTGSSRGLGLLLARELGRHGCHAGVIEVGPEAALDRSAFEDALDVNFWGTVNATLAVLPHMRARGRGRIVTITSIGGVVALPHLLPYTASKFAAVGFSEGLAAEVASEGITVTTVVPGLMRTGSFLHAQFRGRRRQEYTWFSLASTLPLMSMDAERAAQQIVAAMRGGRAERVLSLPAAVLSRIHGLAPGTTVRVAALVNRLLPRADGERTARAPGWRIEPRAPRVVRAATILGQRAADRFNQRSRGKTARRVGPGR